jgi:serine phosphatase RsbU (regulator of sigma subunit)
MTSRNTHPAAPDVQPLDSTVRLTMLAQAGELLAGTLDRRRLAALVTQLVVPHLAQWAALYPAPGTSDLLRPEHVWHQDEHKLDHLNARLSDWSPPVCGSVWPTPVGSPLGQVLPMRLRARREDLGLLVLGGPPREGFTAGITTLAAELAPLIATALDNTRLYSEQLDIVRALQRSLLPPSLPDVPGVDIGVVYEAAGSGDGTDVGGDFYDVFPITSKAWGFAIGDVCGTGPEAAALTGLARHSLRLLAREGKPAVSVVERLNQAVLEEGALAGDGGRFITMLYGEIEPRPDGSAQLVLVCAGHPLPLVLRADGSVRTAATPQLLLGVIDEPGLYAEDVELGPGEVLLAYTDGASERRNGSRMLGDEGVAAVLAGCSGLSASGVVARVTQAVADYAPTASRDDLALLALRPTAVG